MRSISIAVKLLWYRRYRLAQLQASSRFAIECFKVELDQRPHPTRMLRICLQGYNLALHDFHGVAQLQQCLDVAGDGGPDVVERVFHAIVPGVDALDVGDVHAVHATGIFENDNGDMHGCSL